MNKANGYSDSEAEGPFETLNQSTPLLNGHGGHSSSGCYVPRRYIIACLLFLAITIGYAIRVILSVAILDIAKGTKWEKNETTQGLILASFFMGYLFTQLPAGELSRKIGPKLTYIIFFSVASIATILLPVGGSSLPVIIVARIFTGLGEGILFPGTHAVLSVWVPPEERATLLGFVWSGTQVGTMVALGTTGVISKKLGWAFVFYLWGGLGLLWVLAWAAFGIDSPVSQIKAGGRKCSVFKISREESEYLVSKIPALTTPEQPTPWKLLLSKSATWAIVAGHFSAAWVAYVLLGFLPKFLKSLHFEPGSYGLIPYAGTAIVQVIAGKLADLAINRFKVRTVWVRRIWQTIGASGVCLFLALIAGLVKKQQDGVQGVVYLTMAMSIGAFVAAGYGANHIDIGPKYAGPLMGITNSFATIPGVVGIFLTGFILDKTHGSYFLVWILGIAIYAVCTVIFWIWVKGEVIFK